MGTLVDSIVYIEYSAEVNRLDVNPKIIKKLHNKRKILLVQKLIKSLDIIYNEEIIHLYKGNKWFKYIFNKNSLDYYIYFKILEKYKLDNKYRPNINISAQKKAGFNCNKIKKLAKAECNQLF